MDISHSDNDEGKVQAHRVLKAKLCYTKFAVVLALGVLLLLVVACGGRGGGGEEQQVVGFFDGDLAYAHVVAQVEFGARPVGSQALERTGEYIETYLMAQGWETWREESDFRRTAIRNILAQKNALDDGRPVIMLGAHYDTRPYADRDPDPGNRAKPILGANDGASGAAVLLELARIYEPERSGFNVVLAFFDGEDKGNIDGWPFSVGAEAVADKWAGSIDSMILVDMVGDADQQLYYEGMSNPTLAREIWSVAARLDYSDWFLPEVRYSLMDDHVPFLQRGVPAVVIIDFDYPHWHTMADTVDKVSPRSLERVGRVLMEYIYTKQE